MKPDADGLYRFEFVMGEVWIDWDAPLGTRARKEWIPPRGWIDGVHGDLAKINAELNAVTKG